jgi:Plasmid pRiA4b ORF-3-like protein
LEQLPLSPGQEFLYLFDFGDELRHLVKLEAVLPGGAKEGVSYPQITEWHGQAPPQYPAFPG